MNAKITITVPMNKLSATVSEMLESVATDMEMSSIDLTGVSKNVLQENDLLKQIEKIDEIRRKIALLDANLEDCYSILGSYIGYKTKIEEKEEENAQQPAE